MKRNYLCLYGYLLLILCSCGKKDQQGKLEKIDARTANRLATTENVNDIMGFYNFMETPTNGTFGLTQHGVYVNRYPPRAFEDNSNDNYEFTGAFYDANRNIIPGGKVRFGRLEFLPNPNKGNLYSLSSYNVVTQPTNGYTPVQYRSVEGQTWNFTIDPNAGGTTLRGGAPLSGTLYFPQRVRPLTDGPKVLVGSNYFYTWVYDFFNAPGGALTLTWNADAQNDKGVVISIEYDYELSSQFSGTSPTTREGNKLYKAFRVPDNGSYTLQMADLNEMFPNRDIYQPFNILVNVTIGRANYAIASSADGLQKYSVYAGSAAEMPILINWSARPRITP
jgi:hypothetical protein